MRLVSHDHFVILRKADGKYTQVCAGTLASAKTWYKIFVRNHDEVDVEIVRRNYYELDERINMKEEM